MNLKTSELTGAALDWAVAKCEGFDTRNNCIVEFVNPQDSDDVLEFVCMADDEEHAKEQLYNAYTEPEFLSACWKDDYTPSTDWTQGGPIIEREGLCVGTRYTSDQIYWDADVLCWARTPIGGYLKYGPTPLIAAMRCYVASKLGDEVGVPIECLIYDTDEDQ